MEIIWSEDRALTNQEFMTLKPELSGAAIQELLDTLVNKNLLSLIGYSDDTSGDCTIFTYSYVISSEVYYLQQLVLSPSMNISKIPCIVRGLCREVCHLENEEIDRIQAVIKKEIKVE